MLESRRTVAMIALLGTVTLVGCTSTWELGDDWRPETAPPFLTTSPRVAVATGERMAGSATSNTTTEAPAFGRDLSMLTDRPATTTPVSTDGSPSVDFGAPMSRDSTQGVTAVGVFGEVSSSFTPGTGRFDGSGNLAQITTATDGACFDPDLDRYGRFVAFASTQHRRTSDIYIKAVDGRTMTQITADPADDVMPAFAPDSNRIAFTSNRSGNWNIFLTNINGDSPIQLTFDSAHELHPTWSPDGRTLVYCKLGVQSGRWELWMVDVSDTAAPRFLEYGLFPQWNPDPAQSKIVFQRARERGSRLFSVWTIDVIRGEAMHPTEIVSAANAAAMHPSWSPDGSRIVFVTVVDPDKQVGTRPAESDVWVVNQDGKSRTNLTNGKSVNLYPTWGADGTVYFLSDRSGVDNIWAVTAGRPMDFDRPIDMPLVTADPSLQNSDGRP